MTTNKKRMYALIAVIVLILSIITKGGILGFVLIGWGIYAVNKRMKVKREREALWAKEAAAVTKRVHRTTPTTKQDLRTTAAERESYAEELSKQFAHGTLDQGEFDERLNTALNAKKHRELESLVADLPVLP